MNDDVMLSVKGLTKQFDTFTAVDNLNIEVKKGSIHGFIGPNGAGKSTTMKMIVGMYRPTAGTGHVLGRHIGTKDALKLIGYSPERPPVYGNMTATNYLIYLGTISGLSLDEAERRTAELIDWLELSKFKDYDVGGFSAGMRQRIGLAQALVHNPELLILDEPTANLDPPGRMLIKDKLKELNQKENTTIFISSHILPELEQLVDSVTLIHKGKLMVEDTVERITQGFTEGIYLIETSDNKKVMALMRDKPHIKSINIIEGNAVSIHCSDPDALQYDLLKILTEEKIRLIRFGQETMNLEEIFSRSIGLKGASQS